MIYSSRDLAKMVDLTWLTGDGLDEDDGGNDMTFAPVLEDGIPDWS